MKFLVVLVSVVCSVAAEAPYAARGWRPSGPAFELPQKNSQSSQKQYLPPSVPRSFLPSDTDPDVSVQGLPVEEQTPEFQLSPVSGQQFVGPDFNADIARLNERYRQELFQIQQQRIQEALQQRQQTVQPTNPTQRTPGQIPNFKTTPKPEEPTTDNDPSLNEGEVAPDDDKVSVEISKQRIQEYPELLLTPLTQIRLVKNGQLVDSQKQTRGFDGPIHLAALQSILRQNQVVRNQQVQNQAFIAPKEQPNTFVIIPQGVNQPLTEPQYQIQPLLLQPQDLKYGVQENPDVEEVEDNEPKVIQPQQVQPQNQQQFQPQNQQFTPQAPQFQIPQQQYEPQLQLQQPLTQFQAEQQQFLLQQQQLQLQQQQLLLQQQQVLPQAQQYQPQYQPQQPQTQDQNQFLYQQQNYQPIVNQDQSQYYQNQQQVFLQQQSFRNQGQGALQSGFEVNQENGLEDKEETTERNGDGSATAVATAFGDRTRPRVLTQYGAPVPAQSSTELPQRDEAPSTEEGPAVSAEGRSRRKHAKLRNRRVRPVFTVDQSGHLVLSQDQ